MPSNNPANIHVEYPPEPPGRTKILDGHYYLAVAMLKDALDLLNRRYIYQPTAPWQEEWNADNTEARRWLTDTTSRDPFSLSNVLLMMEVYCGIPWDAEAVAESVKAGIDPLNLRICRNPSTNQMRIVRNRPSDAVARQERYANA